jgi:phage FluMu gp28-like protein
MSTQKNTMDDATALSRYFLPYQRQWIEDESPRSIWEKSFRIGATFCDAFKNVRKRIHHKKRDYLFATRDYPSAIEYMGLCKQFCELFNATRSILSSGEETVSVPVRNADGKESGFTEEVKMGYIKFDNGSRIIAFSSNPNAMLVYGGDVGLDEFPRHQRDEELYQIAQARVTMGFDLAMWGSHHGNDTLFYRIALQARAGKGGWKHFFTTIEDAVGAGLVEMINGQGRRTYTRENFIQDCKDRAIDEATYQEAYMCNPRGGTAAIVPWSAIELCQQDYEAERLHLEAKQITELFGAFDPAHTVAREERINAFLKSSFPKLASTPGRHSLGYDVAASGTGDLAAIHVDGIEGKVAWLRGLLTFRTEDWHFHKVASRFFMRNVAGLTACGDETGLGRQVCWELKQDFPGQFTPVNFASRKHDMGFALMNQLASTERRWPGKWQDVSADYFALRKTHNGARWLFSEGTNNHLAASHCDIAWAGALSHEAATTHAYSEGKIHVFPRRDLQTERHTIL